MRSQTQICQFLLLASLFLTIQSKSGQVLPPRNVSAVWRSDFEPGLSWMPPLHPAENCKYQLSVETQNDKTWTKDSASPWFFYETMEGGRIRWSVTTVCDGEESEPAVLDVSYPELVKNFSCYLYSKSQAYCHWLPVRIPPDFRFFYSLASECDADSSSSVAPPLLECSSYNHTEGLRSGCELRATRCHVVFALLNGTLDNEPVRNTFKSKLYKDVRPPPLEWNVTQTPTHLNISWNLPEIYDPEGWSVKINYSECNAMLEPITENAESFYLLPLVAGCQYSIAVRAESDHGRTPWSDWRHFGAEAGPDALVYFTIIVPLVVAFLAALTCVCFQRNKDKILPKVPVPRDFLCDIPGNNNKSAFPNLYIQAEEEENCKISLVMDPQISKQEC